MSNKRYDLYVGGVKIGEIDADEPMVTFHATVPMPAEEAPSLTKRMERWIRRGIRAGRNRRRAARHRAYRRRQGK